MFSKLGDLLESRRRVISLQLLAAIQCVRKWRKAGLGKGFGDSFTKPRTTDDEMDFIY
jgi:hypothetical protein